MGSHMCVYGGGMLEGKVRSRLFKRALGIIRGFGLGIQEHKGIALNIGKLIGKRSYAVDWLSENNGRGNVWACT